MGHSAAGATVRAYLANVQHARQARTDEAWLGVGELLADDVRWRFAGSGADVLWPVDLRGKGAVLSALSRSGSAWDRLRTQTLSVVDCQSVVLVEQSSRLVDDAGVESAKPVAHVFTVDRGRVTEIRTYRNDQ